MPTNSFAPPPLPSRSPVRLPEAEKERPIFRAYLVAFLGVVVLLLLGSNYKVATLGLALLLPGLALIFKPPTTGLGQLGDLAVGGLLAAFLLAFIPQFYWPQAEWRLEGVEVLGIDLPAVLSVQPWQSFEAWLMLVAGFAWLYAALQWPLNLRGRLWLLCCLSILLAGMAGTVIWGHTMGSRYLEIEDSSVFNFLDQSQMANFLAIGGIATFAYAMEGFRTRAVMPMLGLPTTALCLTGLFYSGSRVGVLLYLIGCGLCFMANLRSGSLPRYFKIGVPLAVLVTGLVMASNERMAQRITDFVAGDIEMEEASRVGLYTDTLGMVLDAPISGVGLSNFSAIFPQYREASANTQPIPHPGSDVVWLAAEGGLLVLGLFALGLFAYARCCRGFYRGASGKFRTLAVVAVFIFLLHCLIDVPGHRPGTAYFAILFAAMALPGRERPALRIPTILWRGLGGCLTVFGLVWMLAGALDLSWHSTLRVQNDRASIQSHLAAGDFERARERVDGWVERRPLDWQAYIQRAELTLAASGNSYEAAADFRRARYVEPNRGLVSFKEGRIWLPYDLERAISAWRETLHRIMEDKDEAFRKMLTMSLNAPERLQAMARLSEINPKYRTYFLSALEGRDLMRELRLELDRDPDLSAFDRSQRSTIVTQWIKEGDLEAAATFLQGHGDALEKSWWLWSMIYQKRANFMEAVDAVREHVEPPPMPVVELDAAELARLTHVYAPAPESIRRGTALLSYYISQKDYSKALSILDQLLESDKPPLYLYYWRAECYYQEGDYIESWYAFESYFEQLWEADSNAQVESQIR